MCTIGMFAQELLDVPDLASDCTPLAETPIRWVACHEDNGLPVSCMSCSFLVSRKQSSTQMASAALVFL